MHPVLRIAAFLAALLLASPGAAAEYVPKFATVIRRILAALD